MLRIRVLGSCDAFNSSGALHSAYLLEHEAGTLLLECGPSALAGLKRAGIDPCRIDAILVSHLHGDHFGGIPFLLLDYLFSSCRKRPLQVAGPPTTLERTRAVYGGLYREEHYHELPFDVEEVAVSPGDTLELAGFRVRAFVVPHMAKPFSLGYRLESSEGCVLFSGDSAWTDEFVTHSRGVDLFLCECCTLEPKTDFHTSYADILAHRSELECRRLVLTHLGADVRTARGLDCERAFDGMVLEIGAAAASARPPRRSGAGRS
jgi:ribonuclease BN (tRNA processing enzyme)